jgi:hypothetical protein
VTRFNNTERTWQELVYFNMSTGAEICKYKLNIKDPSGSTAGHVFHTNTGEVVLCGGRFLKAGCREWKFTKGVMFPNDTTSQYKMDGQRYLWHFPNQEPLKSE